MLRAGAPSRRGRSGHRLLGGGDDRVHDFLLRAMGRVDDPGSLGDHQGPDGSRSVAVVAGDDLLKQFATELQLNTRSGDLVGRWGGDEFIVVLSSNLNAAKAHTERVQQWVLGKYTLHGASKGSIVIQVDASIGAAQWVRGQTMQQLVAEADAAMYKEKKLSSQKS